MGFIDAIIKLCIFFFFFALTVVKLETRLSDRKRGKKRIAQEMQGAYAMIRDLDVSIFGEKLATGLIVLMCGKLYS